MAQVTMLEAIRQAIFEEMERDPSVVTIGEDIGADTPAEIAVSVVAELIRLRRKGEGREEGMGKREA